MKPDGRSDWRRRVGASIPLMILSGAVEAAPATGLSSGLTWAVCGAFGALFVLAAAAAGWMYLQRRSAAVDRRRMLQLLDGAGLAAMVAGPDGRALFATSAWIELAPYDAAQPLQGILGRALDGDDPLATVRTEVTQGRSAGVDLQFVDGVRWHLSAAPLAEEPGHTVWRAENMTRDLIRERGFAEQFESLVESGCETHVGYYVADMAGRFVSANATFAAWLGTSAAELAGGETRLPDVLDGGGNGAGSPIAFTGEVTFTGRNFEFDALVDQSVVEQAGGFRLRTLVRNLSVERAELAARRLSEERFRRLFEEAPVGTALLDGEGRITESNAAFARIVGLDRAAAAGSPFIDTVAAADRAQVSALLAAAVDAEARPAPVEVTLANGEQDGKAGGTVVSLFVGRQADGSGGPHLILHLLDLTEQKAVEEQLFQSQKMELIGQLAGGVAHDFNNLLTAMIGFCDLLLQRHTPKDQSFGDIMQVKQNANRAANLVRQLLAFSRQQTLQPKVLTLTDVLAELSQLLRRLIGARIELSMVHGRDLGLVRVDQGQLEQVVINLAVNARDAMAEGGTLNIRTSNAPAGDPRIAAHSEIPDGDYVVIEIADTGMGIAREHLDKIYEPFFTTKEVGSGTGLGLATVYGIIKQTGGYIFVDSTPGEGTTFTIFLPRYIPDEDSGTAAAAAEEREIRDLTGAGRVLLVEDEDAVRLFGARALRNKGYEVLEAVNGEDALEVLNGSEDPIDLVITDVVMPGVDGPTLIRSVRESHPELKVIFISGYAEDTFRQSIDDGGEIHFLPKPFSLQQLAGKVKEVMVEGQG